MATKDEVNGFLRDFKVKMNIWDVLFRDDRGKNSQALAELELRPIDRKKVLEELKVEDYCEGPLSEELYGGSNMWVFGRILKSKEIYIKITMGSANMCVLCISFHIAEHKLKYSFKTN